MNITEKGKKWEILNSLWIVWSFVIFLNYIGFFWIGKRAKQKKWILFGFLYFIIVFLEFLIPMYNLTEDMTVLKGIIELIWFVSWILSIIHSFWIRQEYLVRREAVINNQGTYNVAFREKVLNNNKKKEGSILKKQTSRSEPPVMETILDEPIQSDLTDDRIELNSCTEQQLSELPGVGVALAKRAMIQRAEDNFVSVDDFVNKLELMPHFAVQIEKIAYVAQASIQKRESSKSGRVLDI